MALGLVLAAFAAQVALARILPGLHPYAPFHVAVTLAAGLWGGAAGLVAVGSSILAATHFLPASPTESEAIRWVAGTGLFLVASAVTLLAFAFVRTTRRDAGAEGAALRRAADRHARDTVELANRELLAMLGHELRNPLAAMRTAIVVAQLDGARRRDALDIARRQSDQLAHLVDGLLDVSRVTRGRIPLHRSRLRLDVVVDGAMDAVRDLVADRQHAVAVHMPPDPIEVDGDYVRLVQAVTNLIDNAAKYTHPGGHIDVSATRNDGLAEITVRDDGPGVPRELAPRVFDLFAQGERSLDRRAGGLGVGLTVAKRIAELHGGSVRLDPSAGAAGSEFVLALPALPGDAASAKPFGAAPDGRPVRVLVAEDNVALADTFVVQLQELGHQVQVVHDGLSALGSVRKRAPDVAILDIDLPGMDGCELARRIRRCAGAERTRLVALCHGDGDGEEGRACASGFERALATPLDPEALRATMASLEPADHAWGA
jgi:signal transduction histidine kinase